MVLHRTPVVANPKPLVWSEQVEVAFLINIKCLMKFVEVHLNLKGFLPEGILYRDLGDLGLGVVDLLHRVLASVLHVLHQHGHPVVSRYLQGPRTKVQEPR